MLQNTEDQEQADVGMQKLEAGPSRNVTVEYSDSKVTLKLL
jgi:hypothetical protein